MTGGTAVTVRRLGLVAAATLALVAGSIAAPAQAASPDQVLYGGSSITLASVPAALVSLDVVSSTPVQSVQLVVDGRVLTQDESVEPSRGRWTATADVDLSGLRGPTRLRAVITMPDAGTRTITRWFRAVDPASTGRLPGARNTGVPAGTRLTPSGSITVIEDGAVLEGLDVDGCILVKAKDVTIRSSRVRCSSPVGQVAVAVSSPGDRLTLEDVEVDGLGTSAVCVGWSGYTLLRVNVHGCADGVRFGHRVTIQDSWVHDLARLRTLHGDTLQTTSASDVVIRGNTLDANSTTRGDYNNSAIMLGSETGTRKVQRVLIEGNHLDGGNYTLNVRGDIDATDVTIRDNVFGTSSRYGQVLTPTSVPLGTGNRFASSGAPVPTARAR